MIDNPTTQQLLIEMSMSARQELRQANERIIELTRENGRLLADMKALKAENRKLKRESNK